MNFVIVRYKSAFGLTVIVLFLRGAFGTKPSCSACLAQKIHINIELGAHLDMNLELMSEHL